MGVIEKVVRIAYTKPESGLTSVEMAARERLESAINQAVERFHEETPGQDGLVAIELYPTD